MAASKKKKGNGGAGGRPLKLNDKVSEVMCRCIGKGMPYINACDLAGISYDTFLSWKRKAKEAMDTKPPSKYTKSDCLYIKFLEDIKKAESMGIEKNLDRIINAADDGAWQAGAWILERRYPDNFAKKEKLDMKAEHSGGVSISLQMTDCSKKEE